MIPTKTNPMGLNLTAFTRLQYLESTGTQYINTGILFKASNNGVLTARQYGYAGSNVSFGSRNNYSSGKYSECLYQARGFFVLGEYVYGEEYGTLNPSGWHTITLAKGSLDIDGVETVTPEFDQATYPIYLFALNNNDSATQQWSGKISDVCYSENGVVLKHLIPVLDVNGVACMYDTIGGQYYRNAGTGIFSYE